MKRALICAPLLPEFDRESGSRRINDMIGYLQADGWHVSFVAENGRGAERYIRLLQQRGVATFCGLEKDFDLLLANMRFDVAVFAFWHLAEKCLPKVRQHSPETRVVIDSVDLHFVRKARQVFLPNGDSATGLLDAEYASELLRELNTYASADGVLTVSQKETDLINDLLGDRKTTFTVVDSEELDSSPVPFERRRGILFIGNFRHPPNAQAAEYLCRDVVPRIDPRVLEAHPILVVGNGLDNKIRGYGANLRNVKMVGWVPSVVPYLEQSRLSVIPLLYGAGTKRKLIQALMVGTPSVSTSVGAEGLHLKHGEQLLVADDPQSFADAIGRLANDAKLWKSLAKRGRTHVMGLHNRETAAGQLLAALDSVLHKPLKHPTGLNGKLAKPRGEQDRAVSRRMREAVAGVAPENSTVIVVSRGDERIIQYPGRSGWHFPQNAEGLYAGHYPADSAAAIAHLESLRSKGGQYLLLPATSMWWLDYYSEFKEHLNRTYHEVFREDDLCVIFALNASKPEHRSRIAEFQR